MRNRMSASEERMRALRRWLLAVAAMIFMTLVVGGATRLTVSGLSIVEWKPVTGVLPPLTQEAWQDEFDKYKEIPQYSALNKGMTLTDFKVIYAWEWTHRLLARTTGAVFLLPFLYFLWRGWIPPALRPRLWTIFAGGAALGVIGWWMVSSGLAGTTLVRVSQYRLAFHMTFACAVYAAVLWTARELKPRPPSTARWPLRVGALLIALGLLAQIYLGALVAGLEAGMKYNTWPLIDGALMPGIDQLFFARPLWRNFFENHLMVQLNHRLLADGVWLLSLAQLVVAWRRSADLRGPVLLFGAMTAQAALGIFTLIYQVPLALALAHQAFALVVFSVAVAYAEAVTRGAMQPARRVQAVRA